MKVEVSRASGEDSSFGWGTDLGDAPHHPRFSHLLAR